MLSAAKLCRHYRPELPATRQCPPTSVKARNNDRPAPLARDPHFPPLFQFPSVFLYLKSPHTESFCIVRGRSIQPPTKAVCQPKSITTFFGAAPRLFSSFTFTTLQQSAARTATATAAATTQSLLNCTVFITTTQQTRSYAKSRKKMPPKKGAEEKKILLGRPGNNLKSGIVCTSCR